MKGLEVPQWVWLWMSVEFEVPVGQVSRDTQLAIGFPAWSSEKKGMG